MSHGTLKEHSRQELNHHCTAFKIFPDHSHISVFPVNCSAKYWSRVLCQDSSKAVPTDDTKGIGEYWLRNSTLHRTQYICPDGYYFIVGDFCMRLILAENILITDKDKSNFLTQFDYAKICNNTRKKSHILKLVK